LNVKGPADASRTEEAGTSNQAQGVDLIIPHFCPAGYPYASLLVIYHFISNRPSLCQLSGRFSLIGDAVPAWWNTDQQGPLERPMSDSLMKPEMAVY